MMQAAVEGGDTEVGIMPAGQVSGIVHEIESAAHVVQSMMAEARHVLGALTAAGAAAPAQR
jgi:NAD(P)H-dependent flavin oxidoreductase YrpB (nitropropane dioxygenase family)